MKLREIKKLITLRNRTKKAIQTVDDSRAKAKRKIPRAVWDFIDGGAGEEHAITANRDSLNKVVFQPKYLVLDRLFRNPLESAEIVKTTGVVRPQDGPTCYPSRPQPWTRWVSPF